MDYTPPLTVGKFMRDDSRVRVVVGPFGSGKSMGCIMELLRRSVEQAAYDGVRATKWALIRNTKDQLRQTVLEDVKQYLGPIVHYFVTDSTIQVRATLPDGTKLRSDWIMIPLDTKEDVQRLLSMQLTGAWINEIREVPIDVVEPLLGRTGRYPSKARGGPTWRGIIADTNPWDVDSPYHDALVLNPRPNWKLYHQPSAIGPDAENLENLPDGYYEDLMSKKDADWPAVHVESKWGTSNAGQAVFRKSFNAETHVKDMKLVVNPHKPLGIGLDFGRNPAALITQVDTAGHLLVMKEVVGQGMGLHQFLDDHLRPALSEPPFAGRSIFVAADPAGAQKSQHTEQTAFDVLSEHGFRAYPASTNDVEPRLLAVERLLLSTVQGEPAIQINRGGCPLLVQALGSKYRYRKKRDGAYEELPEKLHPWSDISDALQYIALGTQVNLTGRVLRRMQRTAIPRRGPISAKAWT